MSAAISEEDRAAAHRLMGSEDLCDWFPLGPHDHSSPCVRVAQVLADARGSSYERAPYEIRHRLFHALDQADKHQWFNFVGVMSEAIKLAMVSLRDDLEAARRSR